MKHTSVESARALQRLEAAFLLTGGDAAGYGASGD
jgi:hypothetical protein